MTNDKLSKSYVEKARVRIKALKFLDNEKAYSDVVRQAQECVELLLNAVLRRVGLEIPKVHDVSKVFRLHKDKLPKIIQENIEEICRISRTLRKDRELFFLWS